MKVENPASLLENYHQYPSQQMLNDLIEAYLPFAKRIAKRFSGRGVEIEDLEQVASMGLLKAINRFDPARGIQFISYATPTIMGDLRNYIRDKGEMVRLPREAKNRLYHIEKYRDRFYQKHLREPTFDEIARGVGLSIDNLLRLLDYRKKSEIFSLEASLTENENISLELFVGEEEEGFNRVDGEDWVKWVYSVLEPREKQLIKLRFEQRLGQRETAKHMGVSQMQISRMERKIFEKIRNLDKSNH